MLLSRFLALKGNSKKSQNTNDIAHKSKRERQRRIRQRKQKPMLIIKQRRLNAMNLQKAIEPSPILKNWQFDTTKTYFIFWVHQ